MINGFDGGQKTAKLALDRTVESVGAWSQSVQAAAVETANFTRKSLEDGAATVEKVLGAGSVERAFELQTEFMKASYERSVSQATRLGELYLAMVRSAAKPFEDLVPAAGK
jgi:phasin family protein